MGGGGLSLPPAPGREQGRVKKGDHWRGWLIGGPNDYHAR